jgi:hypothetical protein
MKTELQSLKFKDGVELKHGNLAPHIVAILTAALETAPKMKDGFVWVTQAHRKIRDTLDFHEHAAAFDFRCKSISGVDVVPLGSLWAARMSAKLGPSYDCIAHGTGANYHLHVEYDPR